jgi:hypothetical protein
VTSDVAGHNLILSLSVSRFLTVAVVVVSDLDNLACEEKDGSEVVHTRGVRLATAKSRASAPREKTKGRIAPALCQWRNNAFIN